MANCIKCNSEIKDGAKFCPFCGSSQAVSEPVAPAPVNNEASQPTYSPVQDIAPQPAVAVAEPPVQPAPAPAPVPVQPVYSQPAPAPQPAPAQQAYQQPAPAQPAYQQPAPAQPAYQQPAPAQPAYQQPAYAPVGDPSDHTAEFDPADISDNKVFAMAPYLLSVIGIIIALIASHDSKYVAFHVRQALKLELTLILSSFLSIIPFLGWLATGVCYIIVLVLTIIAFFQVCSGKAKEPAIIKNFGFFK